MSLPRALKKGKLVVGVLALLLASPENLSYGVECLSPTPCPCAADGVCRPNRTTWGYSQTRWRSWPGEPVDQQLPTATPVDEGKEQGLAPYELPLPEQEDLRGPAKDKAGDAGDAGKDETADAPAEAISGDGPAQILPGPEALPAFDPQGNQLEPPGMMDDAPPALPTSLRQAALSLKVPLRTSQQQSSTTRLQVTRAAATPPVGSLPIRQASWQQSHSIQLINPASAMVAETAANRLQQAIYYEASDLGDESTQ